MSASKSARPIQLLSIQRNGAEPSITISLLHHGSPLTLTAKLHTTLFKVREFKPPVLSREELEDLQLQIRASNYFCKLYTFALLPPTRRSIL